MTPNHDRPAGRPGPAGLDHPGIDRGEVLRRYRVDFDAKREAMAYAAGLAGEFGPDQSGYGFAGDPDADPDPIRAWRYLLHEIHAEVTELRAGADRAREVAETFTAWGGQLEHALGDIPHPAAVGRPDDIVDREPLIPAGVDLIRTREWIGRAIADADAIAGGYTRRATAIDSAAFRSQDELMALHATPPTTDPADPPVGGPEEGPR